MSEQLSTTEQVRSRMSRQRRRDTDPEMALRRTLHARGLRFRVDAPLPGMPRRRADLIFTRRRVAVFVDGCFWHGCPEHATSPTNNAEWWAAKLATNVARDRDTDARLAEQGWRSVRIWEHTVIGDAVRMVEDALDRTESRPHGHGQHIPGTGRSDIQQ